jgi:TRAP-type transport system small permease protein
MLALYERALAFLDQRIIVPLIAALLAFITVGTFVQVVLRYVFQSTFLWGEELSLFAFIWSVFLGAVVGVRRKIHLGFDFFGEILKGRPAAVQKLVVNLSILATAVLLLYGGIIFVEINLLRFSPAVGISLLYPTLVIPVSGGLMILAVLPDIIRDLRCVISGRCD